MSNTEIEVLPLCYGDIHCNSRGLEAVYMRGDMRFRRHEISCRYEKTLCLHDVSCRLHFISPDTKLLKIRRIVFLQNVINSIVFSDILKSLHCIALKISCRVCLHENFAPDMRSHVCLFDRHEI